MVAYLGEPQTLEAALGYWRFDRKGALTGAVTQEWSSDSTFVDFARRVATYLDPKNPAKATYMRIADALTGAGTQRLL
jgi:hypothetical protein